MPRALCRRAAAACFAASLVALLGACSGDGDSTQAAPCRRAAVPATGPGDTLNYFPAEAGRSWSAHRVERSDRDHDRHRDAGRRHGDRLRLHEHDHVRPHAHERAGGQAAGGRVRALGSVHRAALRPALPVDDPPLPSRGGGADRAGELPRARRRGSRRRREGGSRGPRRLAAGILDRRDRGRAGDTSPTWHTFRSPPMSRSRRRSAER
jgi:hypothetical protein